MPRRRILCYQGNKYLIKDCKTCVSDTKNIKTEDTDDHTIAHTIERHKFYWEKEKFTDIDQN